MLPFRLTFKLLFSRCMLLRYVRFMTPLSTSFRHPPAHALAPLGVTWRYSLVNAHLYLTARYEAHFDIVFGRERTQDETLKLNRPCSAV